jgi:hypothetical protein
MTEEAALSRPFSLAKFDGRTRKAKFLREVRNELAAQVGGVPSVAQWGQIERAARLSLFIELFDAIIASGSALTAVEAQGYGTFSSALAHIRRDLGLHGADARDAPAARPLAYAAAGAP